MIDQVNNIPKQGSVIRLFGRVFASSRKNATHRLLNIGDYVSDEEKIVTTPGSIIEIKFESDKGEETAVYM